MYTICCRYKDDVLLETRAESGRSTLVLENVSTNTSGTYGCRASNDYSAAVSSGGRVNIRGIRNHLTREKLQ